MDGYIVALSVVKLNLSDRFSIANGFDNIQNIPMKISLAKLGYAHEEHRGKIG